MLHLAPTDYSFPQKFFIEDFGAYRIGLEPSDWEPGPATAGAKFKIVADAALPSGNGLQIDKNTYVGNNYEPLYFERAGETILDCEVLSLMKITVDPVLQKNMRAVGTRISYWPGINGYFPLYNTQIDPAFGSAPSVRITKFTNGAKQEVAWLPRTYAVGDRIWSRIRAIGPHVRMKMWLDGAPEPFEWDLSYDDPSPLPQGYVGL